MVIESSATYVNLRSRIATSFQLRYVPIPRPIAIHAAESPDQNAAAGSPSRSQPDMSDACALSAVTQLPSCRPPRK